MNLGREIESYSERDTGVESGLCATVSVKSSVTAAVVAACPVSNNFAKRQKSIMSMQSRMCVEIPAYVPASSGIRQETGGASITAGSSLYRSVVSSCEEVEDMNRVGFIGSKSGGSFISKFGSSDEFALNWRVFHRAYNISGGCDDQPESKVLIPYDPGI